MKSAGEIRAGWLGELLSTTPADRPRAEAAVRSLYSAAGFSEPRHFIWFDSPFRASWVVALLVAPHHQLWAQKLRSALSRRDREQLDVARSTLGSAIGIGDSAAAVAAAGHPLGMHLQFPPVPSRMFTSKFLDARFGLASDVAGLFTVHGDDDDLARAETNYWGSNRGALRSALHCPTTDQLIGNSFFEDYSFSTAADDEHRVGDRVAPPILRTAWDVARSSGLWWPFEHVAVMSDRPAEVHVNERYLLHRDDGPAVVHRDGWNVFAWNGKAVPEKWIMDVGSVPEREYKWFDPTFVKHAKAKGKAVPTEKTTKRAKPGSILQTALSADHAARLEQLRAHAGGRLPLFDRYQAGAHREVWYELVSLGARVREDPTAADALAVAYETMRRVESNIRTLAERLTNMGYRFVKPGNRDATPRPHVPPPAGIQKRVIAFEKEFGTLPLSLRAFYEVVGEVNFIGRHATLDPADHSVATDPLVVYGLDEGIVEYDEGDEDDDEEGRPSAVTIAPDDLHKANTSGGSPYEMAIPDLRADGELLNERHSLFFVDYLRLCCRFGGFPGYDDAATVPVEIGRLAAGLVEF